MSKTHRHNPDLEPVDNTPVAIPTRLRLPQNRTEQMRHFIRQEMSRNAAESGHETFEEADDIEPDDEEAMPLTPYELRDLEPPLPPIDRQEPVGQPAAVPPANEGQTSAVTPEVPPDGQKK